ncbi:hypothetical protein [Streptomyces sp. NPDC059224]|uniref:hypothetical protein n=1 Tax=Streptomyces sp. NPDC059224 TaxID=3346775 RepID=UPI0036BAF3B5
MVERVVRVGAPVRGQGRQVHVDGAAVGAVFSLRELAEIMRREGWAGVDEVDVANSRDVEWHGGGAEVW